MSWDSALGLCFGALLCATDAQCPRVPPQLSHNGGSEGGVGKRVRLVSCRGLLGLLVEVVAQDLGTRWVAQLGHGLGLDLADTLAGNTVDLADFV